MGVECAAHLIPANVGAAEFQRQRARDEPLRLAEHVLDVVGADVTVASARFGSLRRGDTIATTNNTTTTRRR